MPRPARPFARIPLLFVALLARPGFADTPDDQVAALAATLERQRERLAALQQQAAAQRDAETLRADTLKSQIRAILAEPEFRDTLTPDSLHAGYDRGFFLRSSDERFAMRFNARMQFRWTYYQAGARNRYLAPGFRHHDRAGFDVARVYYAISGHAYTRNLSYMLILDGSEYRRYNFGILHAWVNYRFADELQLRAGIMRVSGTRANLDTSTMQLVETPIVEEAFTLHRGLGVRLWGDLFRNQPVQGQYRLDLIQSLTRPATRSITPDEDLESLGHDNNPALVFRTIWNLLGDHCEFPEAAIAYTAASCDLAFHTQPALSVGGHYAYNEDWHDGSLRVAVRPRPSFRHAGFALVPSDRLRIHQCGLDANFMYRGFSATAEYVLRLLDIRSSGRPPWSPVFQATGEDATHAQQAAYLQCGYFLPIPGFRQKFELVGRVGWMNILTGGSVTTWEYSAGLNYYIRGHGLKLQTDFTHITQAPFSFPTNSLANVNDRALIWRVQLQVAF